MRSNRTESTIYFLFARKESKQRKARYRGELADDLLDDGTEVSLVSEKGREYVVALLNEETEKAINCAKTLGESELLTTFATNLLKRTK